MLKVGCWAYSEYDVIAVSPLVSLAKVPALDILKTGDIITDCAGQSDGDDCFRPGRSLKLGSCFDGTCRERCMNRFDCYVKVSTIALMEPPAIGQTDPPSGASG